MLLPARSRRRKARATILASGLFDRAWVEAQLGRTFASAADAVDAYLDAFDAGRDADPADHDLSPHPLFLPRWIGPEVGQPPDGVDPLLWYLAEPEVRRTASTHPLVEPATILATHPEYAEDPAGPVAAWLRHADATTPMPTDPEDPAPRWGAVLEDARRAIAEWESAGLPTEVTATARGGTGRFADRTSLVLAGLRNLRSVQRWARLAAADAGVDELLVADARPPRWQYVALRALRTAYPALVPALTEERHTATVHVDVAVSMATGDRLVLATDPFDHDLDAVHRLVGALEADGTAVVQPVVADRRTRLVLSAGAAFPTAMPRPEPLLRDHPLTDVPATGPVPIPAALGPVVALRATTYAALGGFDRDLPHPLAATDLSLRAAAAGLGASALVPDARVLAQPTDVPGHDLAAAYAALEARHPAAPPGSREAWRRLGFTVLTHRNAVEGDPGPDEPAVLTPTSVVTPLRVDEHPPRLRWTIDLASPPGPLGRGYGDTHYGKALAEALRRRGQQVAVDNRAARHRPTRDLDDVVLVLRGLDRVAARPGAFNVEWVISHPELVTAEELASFDLVYSASPRWAGDVSRRWGVDVRPLLQATDPDLFNTDRARFDTGPEVLFVGNSRRVFRTSVKHALEAGLEVEIHGNGWGPILGPDAVTSIVVDNDALGAMYAAAGVVLNDHWEDMRQLGFVSNRLMDAAACGARVVSDSVPGVDLAAMFHGLVATHETPAELAHLVAHREELFPSAGERVAAAAKVREEHSFDVRAATLLDDVLQLLPRRSPR